MHMEPDKSNLELLEGFLAKLNSETTFRKDFLDNPVEILKKYGFDIAPEDMRNIEASVNYLKNDLMHIFKIPSGSSDYLNMIRFGIKMPPEIEIELEPGMKVT
jgi:hypothetical protein